MSEPDLESIDDEIGLLQTFLPLDPGESDSLFFRIYKGIKWIKLRIVIYFVWWGLVLFVLMSFGVLNSLSEHMPRWLWTAGALGVIPWLVICGYTENSNSPSVSNFADWMWTFVAGTAVLMILYMIIFGAFIYKGAEQVPADNWKYKGNAFDGKVFIGDRPMTNQNGK